ncbi:putative RNA-directed DNA polymerase from transposon X-element [Trichonephila clavipes]|nr:putative RNA-directed DNA polymerase from transposon X-element [Trichonephila clavipes]
MGDDVMDIHASQSDESLMDDLSPRPSSSGCRVGQRCTLNLSRAETSSRWCGVVVREGASSGVISLELPWFKITWSVAKSPRAAEQCDVNISNSSNEHINRVDLSKCEDFMTPLSPELPWSKNRLADLKSIISTYQPACVALQETFLKSTMTMQVRGYNCVRRDVDGDTSPTGGVCLFTSNLFPSNVVTLHTSLQAVAVRIHVHSLVTVCCVYLPPNDVVPQVDLNHLVSQLPAPFILLGDFNGNSPLWEHDVTNSRG